MKVANDTTTTHRVGLNEKDRSLLEKENTSAAKLITESFRFLLEREPNTSILKSFDLEVIGDYFPEYQTEIRKRLSAK